MLLPAAPTLLLVVGGMALILSRSVPSSRWYELVWLSAMLGAAFLLITGDSPLELPANTQGPVWAGDPFAVAGQWLALVLVRVFGIGSFGIRSAEDRTSERLGFLSFLIAGVMLVGASNDLITTAIAIEIVQCASWALRRVDRYEHCDTDCPRGKDDPSAPPDEALRWLGIVASCFLWTGIALLANLTSATQFDQIRKVLTDAYIPDPSRTIIGSGSKLGLLGIGLIVAGLGSRMGLVPWQVGLIENSRSVRYWTSGCILLTGQLAGALALARLCGTVWIGYRDEMLTLLFVLAVLTCGASGALTALGLMKGEGRLRRWTNALVMLHGGWFTIGLMAATADLAMPEQGLGMAGSQPGSLALILFAMAAGQLGLAGLYLMLSYLERDDRDIEFIDELLGLGRLNPIASTALLIVLASLIGQPPLWGFWSNWLLMVTGLNVRASTGGEHSDPHAGPILALIAATITSLMAAAGVFQFARIVLMEQPIARTQPQGRRAALFCSCLCAIALVVVGLLPARIIGCFGKVRGPSQKSAPDNPAGKSRGSATAANRAPSALQ